MTLQIQFPIHTQERTAEGSGYVQANAMRLGGNCAKLVEFWRQKHYWLSEDTCRQLVGVRNITQRVADLAHKNAIAIESKWDETRRYKLYRMKCTCSHVGGVLQKDGCMVHKLTINNTQNK